MDKEKRILELIDRIQDLNYKYYTEDKPMVSDGEYDLLYDELVKLEKETGIVKEFSPTQKVGGEILEGFEKHVHLGNLWSLGKAQTSQEVIDWYNRAKKARETFNEENVEQLPSLEFIMEYKFDGLTINLTYDDGVLVQGATRGNGQVGEGILSQIRAIKSIPKYIKYKGRLEIQGEGVMPLSALEKYNETADEKLKNARNAAAGALRNLDTSVVEKRNLTGYFYNVGYIEGKEFKSHLESLEFLRENRIPVFPYFKRYTSIEDVLEEIDRIDVDRKSLDVLTDGVVIKINDIRTREVLGYTNKFPRWAIAYKFEAEEMTTILRQVIWNVGRTSKVTPTAVLDPVEIGGATITRATLNNYDDIVRKDLKINSTVLIRRSNDVIPEILGSVSHNEDSIDIEMPTHCPACDSELFQDGVHIFCPNSLSCRPQLVARIVHFASRDAMNIEGLSEKTAEKLIEELDIKDLPDIYEMKFEDLIVLEGFKDKKTNNLLKAIETSKNIPLASFVYALGIRNVGIKTANDLANHYKSLENIMDAKIDDLVNVGEIGEIIAASIVEFFHDEKIVNAIDKLLNEGVVPSFEEKKLNLESIFTDKVVVITGTIEGYNRKEIQEIVETMGGKVTGSVSKKTDFVIAGESAGSKYDKAVELGIEIIDEERFKEVIK